MYNLLWVYYWRKNIYYSIAGKTKPLRLEGQIIIEYSLNGNDCVENKHRAYSADKAEQNTAYNVGQVVHTQINSWKANQGCKQQNRYECYQPAP